MTMTSTALRTTTILMCVLLCVTPSIVFNTPIDHDATTTQSSSPNRLIALETSTTSERQTVSALSTTQGGYPQQVQLPNTLTIVAKSDKRVYYTTTTSGRFEPTTTADLTDAAQPDKVDNMTASGSAAQGGSDRFTFTGRITALTLRGGPARIDINGRTVNPATIPDTTAPPTNTTNFLTLPRNTRVNTSFQQTTLDVSSTLTLDSYKLQGEFRQHLIDQRFAATDSISARRAKLRTVGTHIESRIDQLDERQSMVTTSYNTGLLSTQEFLRELAEIDTAAGQLTGAAERVAARARTVPESTIDGQSATNWAQNRRIELHPYQGPIREQIRKTLRGDNTMRINTQIQSGLDRIGPTRSKRLEPLSVYVETSNDGIVLTTINDKQYYREALLFNERNSTGTELQSTTDALTQVRSLYPWAANNSGASELSGDRRTGTFQATLFHDHGQLTTFLNQSSTRIFAEYQQKFLSSIPTAKPVTASKNGLRVRVNRTHPTGPLEVTLVTSAGDPIDGTVRVNDRLPEPTDINGRLWTITPHGPMTITARANGKTIHLRISSHPPSSRRTKSVDPVAS